MIKKFYVVGTNVSSSLSPLIFNFWFKKYKIKAEYRYREIENNNFNRQIKNLLNEEGVCGLNVTIPFKERIIKKLDKVDRHSLKIGATNLITKKNNKWIGKNTDWIGFKDSIRPHITSKKRLTSMVFGYGGAAKAIIYALQKEKFSEIKICNRSEKKIRHLKDSPKIKILKPHQIKSNLVSSDLIINTTPINIFKSINLEKNNIFLKNKKLGFDVVYKPKETSFLSNFNKKKRIYGIDMLINQAVPCFEEWFGEKPSINKELRLLLDKKISK